MMPSSWPLLSACFYRGAATFSFALLAILSAGFYRGSETLLAV